MALTVRLGEDETNELKSIQEHLEKTTSNSTIKHMISTYMNLNNLLQKAEADLLILKMEHGAQSNKLENIKKMFQMLAKPN